MLQSNPPWMATDPRLWAEGHFSVISGREIIAYSIWLFLRLSGKA